MSAGQVTFPGSRLDPWYRSHGIKQAHIDGVGLRGCTRSVLRQSKNERSTKKQSGISRKTASKVHTSEILQHLWRKRADLTSPRAAEVKTTTMSVLVRAHGTSNVRPAHRSHQVSSISPDYLYVCSACLNTSSPST